MTLIAIGIAIIPATSFAAPRVVPVAAQRGWSDQRALQLAKEAIEAKKAGDLQLCIGKDQASLALEDHPYVKLHLASCLQATGKLVDALTKARDALGAGVRSNDEELQNPPRRKSPISWRASPT